MDYFENLLVSEKENKEFLDELIFKTHSQSVGSGYFEVIVPMKAALFVLSELTKKNMVVVAVSWWCECNDENEEKYGCPHGLGGPYNQFNPGYYSEMMFQDSWLSDEFLEKVKNNPSKGNVEEVNEAIEQFVLGIEHRPEYSPCLSPAFNVMVPDRWRNKTDDEE